MRLNSFARVSFCTLLCCGWACGGTDSSGPGNPPRSLVLTADFSYANARITTPGMIWFFVAANKRLARLELYHASTKIAESTPAGDSAFIGASVTAADNGTQTYVVKAYDTDGAVAESGLISVIVDIRWTLIQNLGALHAQNRTFIATDAASSIYLAGTTDSFDTFLVKYDADGQEQWTRTLGGPDNDYASSIAIDASGRVYVAGYVYSRHCFVNVYDAGGSLLTARQIKPASMDRTGYCIAAADASNNLYVIGSGNDGTRAWSFALRYDSEGNLLWNREITAAYLNEVTGLAIDALGSGIYIGGHTVGTFDGAPNRGPRDLFVVKLDGNGNVVWGSQYGTAGLLTFSAQLTADPNGGVYVAGRTAVPNETFHSENALIASYAADGTRRWLKTVDGGWWDQGAQITVNSRGVYLLGSTYGEASSGHEISEWSQGTLQPGSRVIEASRDIFVARFSVAGDLQALRMLGTPGGEHGDGIVTAANGDIYVAGFWAQPNTMATPLLARLRDAP